MALLILTGEHEAIQLKSLHGKQVLTRDDALVAENGDDAFWFVALRGDVL